LLHGVPLPSLGSFEFYLFSEAVRREKVEKFAFARLLVNVAVESGFVNPDRGRFLLYEYGEDLHQFKYNYNYVPIGKRIERIRNEKEAEDQRLLKKVAAMTVEDKDVGRPR
jgi:hypothetical protein